MFIQGLRKIQVHSQSQKMDKLTRHPDGGSMSWSVEDKDNLVEGGERRPLSWLFEDKDKDKLAEGEEGGPLSRLVKDKDNRIEREEGGPLSSLVDYMRQQYGCSEGEPTLREIIFHLNTEVNPEFSRFCENGEIFSVQGFHVSRNFFPIYWMQNGPAGLFGGHQQSLMNLPLEKQDSAKQLTEVDFCKTTRNYLTREKRFLEQRRHFPDVNRLVREGSWMTFNSGATNQWEEEEKLEEMWEKSNQWEEEEKLEKSQEELEVEDENRERPDKSPTKGQLAGRTKYTSISEVPDHLDLEEELGGGRFLENR